MNATTQATPADLPLHGITVVDLTRVLAGPACTQILGDLGARVIKVEQPGTGDDARAIGPFVEGTSAYFLSVNRNKESIALDLKQPADREVFERLLERADVLVENYRPGTMEKLGYGWAQLHARYPLLVMTSVSGFGQTGPYRGFPAYDMVVQAMSGMMSVTGHPGTGPCRVGVSIGDLGAGLYAVIGTQSALMRRARTGQGERVDVSMLDCQVALLENAIARYGATGSVPGPIGSRHPSMTPFDVFAAQDGWFVIAVGSDALFKRLCDLLELPALAGDARFESNAQRCTHEALLKELLEERLRTRPRAHWLQLLADNGIPTGEYSSVAEIVDHPQVQARGMFTQVQTGGGQPLRVAGNPLAVGQAQPLVRRQPPALDADRERILQELAMPQAPLA
ncbi:L-carnitine dehydratase/bile acid-inducible protein F [Acidovorax delafieldii 2AN]|uniref:L-carnitine dehydratase/bile acid-inducible protein F n=1 Tax=Acidovorax delafieldii 2AN TaxID=573060 RepID=C5T0I0_ACIDE|nr:CoA transferase [Acidovorax delafieldii]EER61998.1 L-carnitine dehydratase/bile acid-inducible protein F [Acidovorax delafieldii 2AN]